ncbi:DUF2341 domain-containing protein [Methanobacterium sp.]|uniref:DUF2341 domain-containing protein n=1 Tax=Methanobacterium sp. TaxID=2164 RepID=UPI003157F933
MTLEGWDYISNPIEIIGSPDGAKTDLPVFITVHYNASYMQSDYRDIRFTSDDQSTILDHVLISHNASQAVFLVKIPSLPASPGTINIYIWAGNSEATDSSNPQNVYLIYDEFTGADNWINMGGADHSITNGHLECTGYNNGLIEHPTVLPNDISIEYKVLSSSDNYFWATSLICNDGTNIVHGYLIDPSTDSSGQIWVWNNTETGIKSILASALAEGGSIVKIDRIGSELEVIIDGWYVAGVTDSTFLSGGKFAFRQVINRDKVIDYVKIRQTTANPPTVGEITEWKTPGPVSGTNILKTIYNAIRPHAILDSLFTVRIIQKNTLNTRFCIRKYKLSLPTIYNIKLFTYPVLSTIYAIKEYLVQYKSSILQTEYTINKNSAASKLSSVFYVNGIYIKDLKIHGTILDADIPDRNKPRQNKQIKVIIGGNIYV